MYWESLVHYFVVASPYLSVDHIRNHYGHGLTNTSDVSGTHTHVFDYHHLLSGADVSFSLVRDSNGFPIPLGSHSFGHSCELRVMPQS